MNKTNYSINLQLAHAFGSTCSFKYSDAIAICDEGNEEPKILFPAGKTMAKKYIDRQQMDFIKFQNSAEAIQCIHILPTHTHVATSEKLIGSNLRVVRIYNIKNNDKPQTIKIFNEQDGYGIIKNIVFSYSQPQFMCCLIGEPHYKLIYIDISKNKSLAESNFIIKDVDKITISPKNSHLICVSGGNSVRLFKVQEYAFKPYDDIHKLPKNRKFLTHGWYKNKTIFVVTDHCQVIAIQQTFPGQYQVKQQYTNVFNEPNNDKITISAICPFSKGFILGSSNGKFCLWTRKDQSINCDEEKLQLTRKWATTQDRASNVTGIAINVKQDLLAISFANNDIASIFLNQLLPQTVDITSEKEGRDIFFQYLYKGFHNQPVTGMDVCLQRPLLATCSQDDSTIRIWNYKNYGCKLLRMFYFRLKENDNKPLITLSFHPCGYYLAVGCKDKLRFFYVLHNELRPYREIAVKGAHIVKFSHGGHLIATASQIKEDSPDEVVHIYNAVTLQEIKCFYCNFKKIRSLQWKQYDEYLCAVSQNGLLIQWRVIDWKQQKRILKQQYKYQICKYYHTQNSIIIFATLQNKYYIHIYKCSDNKYEQIQIDMKIIAINEIIINKISCLVFGLDNGSILTLSYCNKIFKTQCFTSDHIKSVKLFSVSPCNKYLISCGDDSMIFIYHTFLIVNGEKCQQDNCNQSVDDFLADVVLYQKKQFIRYEQKQQEHTKTILNLQKKLKSILQQSLKKKNQKIQQLQLQKNRIIDDLNYRIQRIKQQINTINIKNNQVLLDLDQKNYHQVEQIQQKYQSKLIYQKQKYFELEQQIIQQHVLHQQKIKQLENLKIFKIQSLKQQFKNKFTQSQKIYSHSKNIVNNTNNIFDEKIKQIQLQQQQQHKQLQQRLQYFKNQKLSMQQQYDQKLQKIKIQYNKQIAQYNNNKKIYQNLIYNKKKIDKQFQQLKLKLSQINQQYLQKISIFQTKQSKINQLQTKYINLQKNKHILSYKATQIKKIIQPKQIQIDKLKLDLIKLKKQFQSSLQRKQKFVLYMQKIQKQRFFLQKQLLTCNNQINQSNNMLDKIIYDIYNCIENNKQEKDSKSYSRSLIQLYHTYVDKCVKKNQIHNQKGGEQMTKQIVQLQKSLFQMNQSNKKNIIRKHDEITKRINENAQLINNLNDIKKQNIELSNKIKQKMQQIQTLKQTKNSKLTQLKKYQQPQYQYNQNKTFDNIKLSIQKNKYTILDIKPQQKNYQILFQFKKKQCQLVSQIQFIQEKICKADYFIKDIKSFINKHNISGKCVGEIIKLEDISSIL